MILKIHTFVITLVPQTDAAVEDIRLIDITPESLLSHSAIDLALTEYHLYTLGAGNKLFNSYDIHDIVNPRRTAILELPAISRLMCIGDGTAYVLCPGYGLVVIDLGNPNAPRLSETYEFDIGTNPGLMVRDGFLYLHDGSSTLTTYELIRPWELNEVSSVEFIGGGDLVYSDGFIYAGTAGVQAIDITDPYNMKLASEYTGIKGSIWGLTASDGMIITIDDTDTITILRETGGGGLEEISSINVGHVMLDVAVNGKLLAAATPDNLITFDISKPEDPEFQGSLPLICELRKIAARDRHFLLASELDGPLVVDVTNPLRQRVVAYQAGLGLVSTIASRGNLMLTGSWDSIRALERHEEGDIEIVGIQHSEGFTREMQITGDFAYLADPTRGLRVFNVSRPIFMRPVALLELPGTPSDVELVIDELAFVALGDEGVAQVNVHYPFSPILRMIIDTERACTNITRSGDFLYFISPDGFIDIYDISSPTNPRQTAWMDISGIHPIDAVIKGNLMAISGGTDGMWLFDVTEPIRPVLRSKYITDGSVETADLFEGGAILELKGPGFCKLEIVDLRHIFAPFKRVELQLKERSNYRDKIHVVGDRAYLAAYNYGMKIIAMEGLYDKLK